MAAGHHRVIRSACALACALTGLAGVTVNVLTGRFGRAGSTAAARVFLGRIKFGPAASFLLQTCNKITETAPMCPLWGISLSLES
jgi:hypothetical protein